jgi:hypothetical protein
MQQPHFLLSAAARSRRSAWEIFGLSDERDFALLR